MLLLKMYPIWFCLSYYDAYSHWWSLKTNLFIKCLMFRFYDPSLVCYLSFPCWNVDRLDLVRVTTAALNSWVPTVVVPRRQCYMAVGVVPVRILLLTNRSITNDFPISLYLRMWLRSRKYCLFFFSNKYTQTYYPDKQLHTCLQWLRCGLLSGVVATLSRLWHDHFHLGETLAGARFVP